MEFRHTRVDWGSSWSPWKLDLTDCVIIYHMLPVLWEMGVISVLMKMCGGAITFSTHLLPRLYLLSFTVMFP